MTTTWVLARKDEDHAYYDTETAALAAYNRLNTDQRRVAAVYPIDVEPEPRPAEYWNRPRSAA